VRCLVQKTNRGLSASTGETRLRLTCVFSSEKHSQATSPSFNHKETYQRERRWRTLKDSENFERLVSRRYEQKIFSLRGNEHVRGVGGGVRGFLVQKD